MLRDVVLRYLLLVATYNHVLSTRLLQDDGLDLEDGQLVQMPEDIDNKITNDQTYVPHRKNFDGLSRVNRQDRNMAENEYQFTFEPARLLHVPKLTHDLDMDNNETDMEVVNSKQHVHPQKHSHAHRYNYRNTGITSRDVLGLGDVPPINVYRGESSVAGVPRNEQVNLKREGIDSKGSIDGILPKVDVPDAVHQFTDHVSPQDAYINANLRSDDMIVPQFPAWNSNPVKFSDDDDDDDALRREGYSGIHPGINEDGSENTADIFLNDLHVLPGNTSYIENNIPDLRSETDETGNVDHASGYIFRNHPVPPALIRKRSWMNGFESIYTPENLDCRRIDNPYEPLGETQGYRRVKEVNEMDEDGLDFVEVHNGRRNAEFSVPKRVPVYSDEFDDIGEVQGIPDDTFKDSTNGEPQQSIERTETDFSKYQQRHSHQPKLTYTNEHKYYSPLDENLKLVEYARPQMEQGRRNRNFGGRLEKERIDRLKEKRRRWEEKRKKERKYFLLMREHQRIKEFRDRARQKQKFEKGLQLPKGRKQNVENGLSDNLGLVEPRDVSALAVATANAAKMLRELHRSHESSNRESEPYPENGDKPNWE